jgi:signal peptide peptidase SppA
MNARDLFSMAKLHSQPLALDPSAWPQIVALDPSAAKAPARKFPSSSRDSAGRETIYMHGPIEGATPGLLSILGIGFCTESIARALSVAAADDRVDEIVLDINSPGGSVEGIPELAAAIRRAGRTKATTAFVHYTAASAAYWLAAQCDRIVCAPSGQVGSIGVYVSHEDQSGALAKAGVKVTPVFAGRHKLEGNSWGALDADARSWMQKQVDDIYDQFVDAVAAGRNVPRKTVLKDFGQGRMLSAGKAKAAGMVDYVAASVQAAPVNAAIALKRTNALARRM